MSEHARDGFGAAQLDESGAPIGDAFEQSKFGVDARDVRSGRAEKFLGAGAATGQFLDLFSYSHLRRCSGVNNDKNCLC
ncbi:MAG: hypothetical protein WCI22_01290 [Actinomycetota bacterium]